MSSAPGSRSFTPITFIHPGGEGGDLDEPFAVVVEFTSNQKGLNRARVGGDLVPPRQSVRNPIKEEGEETEARDAMRADPSPSDTPGHLMIKENVQKAAVWPESERRSGRLREEIKRLSLFLFSLSS